MCLSLRDIILNPETRTLDPENPKRQIPKAENVACGAEGHTPTVVRSCD